MKTKQKRTHQRNKRRIRHAELDSVSAPCLFIQKQILNQVQGDGVLTKSIIRASIAS